MLTTEPIVTVFSALSGFADGLIFMFIASFGLVYSQWMFNHIQVGLTFIPLLIGYVVGWAIACVSIRQQIKGREGNITCGKANFEARIGILRYTAPLLPLGLVVFAWTSTGPPIHWSGTCVASVLLGIANYLIYMTTGKHFIFIHGSYSVKQARVQET